MKFKLVKFDELLSNLLNEETLEESLSKIIRDIETEFKFQSMGIFLKHKTKPCFKLKIGRNLGHDISKKEYFLNEPFLSGLVMLKSAESKYPEVFKFEHDYSHLLVYPLHFHKSLFGFVFLDIAEGEFTEDERLKLEMFSVVISMVIQIFTQQQKIEALVQADDNSGLLNYTSFVERSSVLFSQAQRYDRRLSMLVLEICKYQEFYHTVGEKSAREWTKKIADTIKTSLRKAEIIGAIPPDKFLVILPENKSEDDMVVIRRLEEKILDVSPNISKDYLAWGVATFNNSIKTIEELIKIAEECAFEASRKINGNIVFNYNQK